MGYNSYHKGYRYLSPSGRIYISRHVCFNEMEFPYQSLFSHDCKNPLPSEASVTSWLPLTTNTPHSQPHNCPPTAPTPSSPTNSHDDLHPTPSQSSSIPSHPWPTSPIPTMPLLPSPSPPSQNLHPMTTRAKFDISRPKLRFIGLSQLSPSPNWLSSEAPTFVKASLYPQWQQAIRNEFQALQHNHTWDLVPPSSSHNFIGTKWVYKIKRDADGCVQ